MSLCTRTRRAEYQWNWNNVLGMNLGKKIEINTTNSALFTQNLSFVSLKLELDKNYNYRKRLYKRIYYNMII